MKNFLRFLEKTLTFFSSFWFAGVCLYLGQCYQLAFRYYKIGQILLLYFSQNLRKSPQILLQKSKIQHCSSITKYKNQRNQYKRDLVMTKILEPCGGVNLPKFYFDLDSFGKGRIGRFT